MDGNNSDREEIDLLVSELMAKPREPLTATLAASQPIGKSAPPQLPDAWPVAAPQVESRPGSRWASGHLEMPSRRGPGPWERFASRFATSVPQFPDLSRYFRMPGPVTMVRMWVGLGALHSASMTFWPYPKTYLWGLVLYLLSLALVLVTGIWGARLSWEARLGAAHTVALGTVLWAVTLATVETLAPI